MASHQRNRRKLKLSLTESRTRSDVEEQAQEEHVNEASDNHEHEAYFSANFKSVCSAVLSEDSPERHVFSDGEASTVQQFMDLPSRHQQLYVRLFLRKHQWLRVNKLKYDRIAEDLTPIAAQLVSVGFLLSEDELVDKREALNLLQVTELKGLCRDMKMPGSLQHCQKSEIINALFTHAQQHRPLFGSASFIDIVFKRVKAVLGCCVCVAAGPVQTFSKCLLLYSQITSLASSTSWAEEGEMTFSDIIYKLLQVKTGQMVFPEYDVCVTEPLFRTAQEFSRFYRASQDMHSLVTTIADSQENHGVVVSTIKAMMRDFKEEVASGCSAQGFMERMTTGWVLAKTLTYGVEYLEKRGDYQQATDILELLLSQTKYGSSQRGHWLERLTLNLDFHLREKHKCLEVIESAMKEPGLHPARQLSLIQRANKLCNATSSKSKSGKRARKANCQFSISDFPQPNLISVPEVVIEARQYHIDNRPLYAIPSHDDPDTYSFVNVEGLAMHHYSSSEESWPCAVHAERSTFSLMFCLLMWDVVFCPGIPNAFRTQFQAGPLDLLTDEFYHKRRDLIETRLEWIQLSKNEDLARAVESCWEKNHGRVCHGADWDILLGVEDAKSLAVCMGGELLSHVCRQFARFYRQSPGGLPDLTLWNPSKSTCKFVEVKGPGDRLSSKQIVWLSRLSSWGCQVEVCRVKAQPR